MIYMLILVASVKKNKWLILDWALLLYSNARHIRNELLPSLFEHRDNLYNELSRVTRRDEDEYSQLCSYVRDYEAHLKKVVSELDLDRMAHTFISEEYINKFKGIYKRRT